MKITSILCLIIVFVSCDPIYVCYFTNNGDQDILVKVSPPLEELFSHDFKDTLISYRIEKYDSFSVYKIPGNYELMLYNSMGIFPDVNEFPIEFIEIYSNDTLTLDTKEKIISAFKKTKNKVFKIEIN